MSNFFFPSVVNNFYARLSRHDKEILDASSMGSFTSKKDKGKESGINYEYDCIKSFVETDSLISLVLSLGLIHKYVLICINLLLLILISIK